MAKDPKNPLEINEDDQPINDKEKEQVNRAVALVNSGIENLSPEQLAMVYKVLKSHSGEVSDAGKAFSKLDGFVQGKLNDYASGKTNFGPSELQGVENLNSVTSEGRTEPEIEARKKAVDDKVKAAKEKNASDFNVAHLTTNDGPAIEANLNAVDRMLENFDPLAKNEKGELVNPEMKAFASFFDHMELDVSDPESAQSKEALMKEAMALVILQAQTDLALMPNYRNLDDAEKKKLLVQAIASNADAIALKMVKAQMMAEFKAANQDLLSKQNLTDEEKAELEKRIKEFNNKVKGVTKSYIEGRYADGQKINISNMVATASVIEGGISLVNRTTAIHEKTGFSGLLDRAKKFNAEMKAKHPKMHKAVSRAMVSGAVGFTTGGVGLAALAVYRSGQTIRDSYKGYKESGFEGNYLQYLRKNPKELTSLVTTTVLAGVSVYFGGVDYAEHGLNAVGVIGKSISGTAAQAATNRVTKALVRGSISAASGLTNAMVDIRAAAKETDPAKKKQLLKNAAKTAGLSIGAGALGLGLAEYAGDGINWIKGKLGWGTPNVDAVTAESPKVTNLNTNTLTNNDMDVGTLDKRLHDLGVNPDVYKDMSPMDKMMLMRNREAELGDLAKPEKSTEMQQLQEGQAPSEAQLKNMLNRNAERHPDLDLKKVYSQLEAAGIKNPEVAFYKMEQARLLAPNDKIMTVDGTNIRDTMKRVLSGESLTAADMKIMETAQANVGNGGHYLNDVRSQGGTGYSYRPRGVEGNEHTSTSTVKNGGGTKIKVGAEDLTAAAGENTVDVSKLTEEQRVIYDGIKKSLIAAGVQDIQGSTNKAFTDYEALLKAGKTEEASAYLKGLNKQVEAENSGSKKGQTPVEERHKENEAYRAEEGDSRRVLTAKRGASQAEISHRLAVDNVKVSANSLKEVQNLPVDDPRRIAAEYKHAEAMKIEVKKQMELSKAQLKLAKAERDQLGDTIEDRKKMELRMQKIGQELQRYGIEKPDTAQVTGEYGSDRRSVKEYFKDALRNKKHLGPATKLLKEREELYEAMKAQGPRTAMEAEYEKMSAQVDSLSKRGLYTQNEVRERQEYGSEPSKQTQTPVGNQSGATPAGQSTPGKQRSSGR